MQLFHSCQWPKGVFPISSVFRDDSRNDRRLPVRRPIPFSSVCRSKMGIVFIFIAPKLYREKLFGCLEVQSQRLQSLRALRTFQLVQQGLQTFNFSAKNQFVLRVIHFLLKSNMFWAILFCSMMDEGSSSSPLIPLTASISLDLDSLLAICSSALFFVVGDWFSPANSSSRLFRQSFLHTFSYSISLFWPAKYFSYRK